MGRVPFWTVTTLQAPLYIPGEICSTVGADPSTPPDQCLALVEVAVAAQGISAPPADVPGLRQVIDQAREDGIDLKIVVLDRNPPMDTPLRDVATVIGSSHPDATVLVLSPSHVGSYSTHFPRATLEIGEDNAKTGNAVQSAQNFLHELTTPQFPWTAFTIVVVIGVLIAAVGTRILQVRSRRSATAPPGEETRADGADLHA
ncbi:hypothetical protein MHEC_26310 [Mycobacterium heckeshornense]|uniref:Uncharacterized protein n=1 Tax=Mycobacterium heckeshornense TaxID=110505 RepID=A0A7R7JI43_9MYCO|nr:hypothetical protein MHEC_26310 [Mycobacterium heckeshornense]